MDALKCSRLVRFLFLAFLTLLVLEICAFTDPSEVMVLQELYVSLNYPSQLKKWTPVGGDPCGDLWTGVSCFGSSITHIDLHGQQLTGFIGGELHNLQNLKQLDVSSNNIQGGIPYSLPLNVTHINLARNNFTQNIPHSLTNLSILRYLNLSHNSLHGPIGDVFVGLHSLKEMDLSHNDFNGDLPSSFQRLENLSKLFLEHNSFTGSVVYLSSLPLTDLNIQKNHFSGVIPEQFQSIRNLWIDGNNFHIGGSYRPWNFPSENWQNISDSPKTKSSAIENFPSHKVVPLKKKLGLGGVAAIIGGGTFLMSCAALLVAIHIKKSRAQKNRSFEGSQSSFNTLPLSVVRDLSSAASEDSPQLVTLTPPPIPTPNRVTQTNHCSSEKKIRRSFSRKQKMADDLMWFTLPKLQLATNNFSNESLLGEGSLGSVFKAEFPDGQVMAVKNISTVELSLHEEEEFLNVICRASHFRHPNIVKLHGYCTEHGQHLLVYEYISDTTLDAALHTEAYKPLPWGTRLRISLGIAKALEYLHSSFCPPAIHSNLKASNVFLDLELKPHLSDCGLAVLRPLTSNIVKLKASEMAITNAGYIAPEHGQAGSDGTKCDIYAFGVLLLELLTGRRPFDHSTAREEQSLVKWAWSRLHDKESLQEMVDPGIKRSVHAKALSQYADIISVCIQVLLSGSKNLFVKHKCYDKTFP
uniref:Protein kinase domain-containing protein n=1 Tax=Kalanchoe fedtschenkoi TaxID=63787 RepID=A0A7N0U6M3_KALFE